jgi:hypothetical protein
MAGFLPSTPPVISARHLERDGKTKLAMMLTRFTPANVIRQTDQYLGNPSKWQVIASSAISHA